MNAGANVAEPNNAEQPLQACPCCRRLAPPAWFTRANGPCAHCRRVERAPFLKLPTHFDCPCGSRVTVASRRIHNFSYKHQDFVAAQKEAARFAAEEARYPA